MVEHEDGYGPLSDAPDFQAMVDEIANRMRQAFYDDDTARLSSSSDPGSWRRMARSVLVYMDENWGG